MDATTGSAADGQGRYLTELIFKYCAVFATKYKSHGCPYHLRAISGTRGDTAWWGDDAVVTRSGGLSKGSRGYNLRVLCPMLV